MIALFTALPTNIKKWVAGGALAVVLYIAFQIYMRGQIRKKARQLEMKRHAKELEKKSAKNRVETKKILGDIAEIDKEIKTNKQAMKEADDAFKNRINASRLKDDKKKALFDSYFGAQ